MQSIYKETNWDPLLEMLFSSDRLPPVPLPRSAIHGRGLFCKRNIEAGEMVIEYAGNVIRSVLTDKREKYYDSKVRDSTASPC